MLAFASRSAMLRTTTAFLLILPLMSPAVAQTAEEDEDGVIILLPISVYGDRQGSSVRELPASIVVLEGAQLQARGQTDMKEITRYTPGVTVNRQVNADPFSTLGGFTIRGVGGNRVQMLVDGSRMAERITDGTRDYMDFSFTKQVDIVKGPASVLWGADALGGVVAVETIDPEDVLEGRERGGTASMSFDSLSNKMGISGVFAQQFGPDLAVMVGVSRSQGHETEYGNARADGGIYGCGRQVSLGAIACDQLNPADITANRVLAKAVWTPSDQHRLEFSADLLQRDTDVRNLAVVGLTTSGSSTTTGDVVVNWDRSLEQTRQRLAVQDVWTPDSGFVDEVRTTFAYTPHVYDQSGTRLVRNASTGVQKIIEDYRYFSEDFLELDIQATSRFATGAADHEVTWGFDGDLAMTDFARRDVTTNLSTGVTTETRATGFNFANATTRRADVYVQDKITMFDDALELTPGLRFATYSMSPRPDDDYAVVDGSEPTKRSKSDLLKSLGVTYRFADTWQVWGHYGEGFKMPTAEQLYVSNPSFGLIPNPDLVPEEVESIEVGLRHETDRGYFGVTAFSADYTNFIASFQPVEIDGVTNYTSLNLQSVKVHGVELEGAFEISKTLRLNGSAAWQKGTQRATADAETTPHTLPPLTGTLGVSWDVPNSSLTLDVVGTFAAAVTETASETSFKPAGYGIVDVFAKWDVAENAVLNVGVKNLFDKRYFEASAASLSATSTSATSVITPLELQTGAGRVFSVSLDMKF